MALIGEAGTEAEFGERNMGREQTFAGGADAQAMDVLAKCFRQHGGETRGRDARDGRQLRERARRE